VAGLNVLIRAAGGVVYRDRLICLVHRPRYNDWSLPKGKLSAGEHPLAAAVREVWEETGVRAAPVAPLPSIRYLSRGVPKVVDYWAMRIRSADPFTPGSEVDAVRWVSTVDATGVLTYRHDADVVDAFAAQPAVTGTVLLVRHGSAGRRGSWPGPDVARPLDRAGQQQAASLSELLAVFAPERVISAGPRRCVSTMAPLAERLDLPVEVDSTFDEETDPGTAAAVVRSLAGAALCTVVCSQRGLLPEVVGLLVGDRRRYPTPKGAGWLLPFAGATVLGAYPVTTQ
jgi:8-oxo-dGTP diphosphatase